MQVSVGCGGKLFVRPASVLRVEHEAELTHSPAVEGIYEVQVKEGLGLPHDLPGSASVMRRYDEAGNAGRDCALCSDCVDGQEGSAHAAGLGCPGPPSICGGKDGAVSPYGPPCEAVREVYAENVGVGACVLPAPCSPPSTVPRMVPPVPTAQPVSASVKRVSNSRLRPNDSTVLERIRGSPVVHADETGWREDGVNGYVWTFSTPTDRYFVRRGRGKKVVDEVLGESFDGVLVSDFYAAYKGIVSRTETVGTYSYGQVPTVERWFGSVPSRVSPVSRGRWH